MLSISHQLSAASVARYVSPASCHSAVVAVVASACYCIVSHGAASATYVNSAFSPVLLRVQYQQSFVRRKHVGAAAFSVWVWRALWYATCLDQVPYQASWLLTYVCDTRYLCSWQYSIATNQHWLTLQFATGYKRHPRLQRVKKSPRGFLTFFTNGWEFLINFLHTYYRSMFLPMQYYKFLFIYSNFDKVLPLRLFGYAILSTTT